MDFINPNPLCCHLTRHSFLSTLNYHNNSTALAPVSAACTYVHIRTHTQLTAGSELWFCQHCLPQRSEQYLSHQTVKQNLIELQSCVHILTRTHMQTFQPNSLFAICILIHSTDPRLYVWRMNLAHDLFSYPKTKRYEEGGIASSKHAARWGPRALLQIEERCFINPAYTVISLVTSSFDKAPPYNTQACVSAIQSWLLCCKGQRWHRRSGIHFVCVKTTKFQHCQVRRCLQSINNLLFSQSIALFYLFF